jgi:hypothetical protein
MNKVCNPISVPKTKISGAMRSRWVDLPCQVTGASLHAVSLQLRPKQVRFSPLLALLPVIKVLFMYMPAPRRSYDRINLLKAGGKPQDFFCTSGIRDQRRRVSG